MSQPPVRPYSWMEWHDDGPAPPYDEPEYCGRCDRMVGPHETCVVCGDLRSAVLPPANERS